MILIGGKAIKHHVNSWREPQDTDLVGTYQEVCDYQKIVKPVATYPINSGKSVYMKASNGNITEAEIAWEGSRAEKLVKFVEAQEDTVEVDGFKIPSLDVLYLLKCSHKYLKNSKHFLKTMRDIQALEKLGAKIRPSHMEFFLEREKDTYNYSLPKLNKSKEEFFSGDGIVYEFQHDSLHEAVKLGEFPAYTYYTDEAVWSCGKKFEQQTEEIKLRGVYEEAAVLAAERSQLAFTPRPDSRWSFEYALSKVCTSITGGWFRKYAYNNYDRVIELYEKEGYNYMEKVDEGIRSGVVKRT